MQSRGGRCRTSPDPARGRRAPCRAPGRGAVGGEGLSRGAHVAAPAGAGGPQVGLGGVQRTGRDGPDGTCEASAQPIARAAAPRHQGAAATDSPRLTATSLPQGFGATQTQTPVETPHRLSPPHRHVAATGVRSARPRPGLQICAAFAREYSKICRAPRQLVWRSRASILYVYV